MTINNRERIGRALDLLQKGLYPFLEREMGAKYGDKWVVAATPFVSEDRTLRRPVAQMLKQDVAEVLKVMWNQWNEVFNQTLGKAERSLVSELMLTRNAWAHNQPFSTDDTYRALDSINRLLTAICAPEADDVEKQKQELLRIRFEEQARRETRKAAATSVETHPVSGFKPWREVVTPHPDVASGRYQQAEFAADLWQVYLDEGSDEYRLPTEFFRRTYLTEGLKQLLLNALQRFSGQGGDPVIELQTNFGGGKTHALLALYHLCFGVPLKDLPELEPVLTTAGMSELPENVKTAVIVGNKIPPGQPDTKTDGTVVRTLWGEIAWQLGGKEGYEMLRETDETATNPGDILKDLFNRYAPCLILIDEWVAYGRQLHDDNILPGGSFDTHFTFAQTLSESAKNADRTLLVVSIPSSDIEVGGEKGREALNRLKNAIGRVESPWRPASAEESFEIVRRRLFQNLTDPNLFVARDAVVRAFSEMYRNQPQEFPLECREADYERRLKQAYPIHPELFDRLYNDWSSLDKFQRTRGVLRLMAKVITVLWEQGDRSLMILPANIPMGESQIQSELTRYLEDSWVPVIEKDVDGTNSLPMLLEAQNTNLGKYSACRRVTRTIYLGSAPTLQAANRGLEDRRIKLGCVHPGESVAIFGDALRRLSDQATYIYVSDGNRYWISTQPNVTRTAQDRAQQISEDIHRVWEEIISRLRTDKERGEFAGVHIAPNSSADVPDEENMGVRLVVLAPQYSHSSKAKDSPALEKVTEILSYKGASPRYCKNLLLFLTTDKTKLDNVVQHVCQFLAWDSIVKEKDSLNLDVSQTNQAQQKQEETNKNVNLLLQDTYQWLLIPHQPDAHKPITWEEIRIPGQDSFIIRASRRFLHEEQLILKYSPSRLRLEILDSYIWSNADHVDLKTLWKYFTQYLYLPRLKDEQVLLNAVQEGVAALLWKEYFAYASGYDQAKGRYLGLKACEGITATLSSQSWLVKAEVAEQQLQQDTAVLQPPTPPTPNPTNINPSNSTKSVKEPVIEYTPPPPPPKLRRFYGSVNLDPQRVIRDAEQVTSEIVQHLGGLVGADIQVTLDIQVQLPDGIPENVIRTVTENCRSLKFKTYNFEEE
ncbi:Swt1 family HEPN domain-containing protein [Anabaenopsis sp. FSS-46]|uniref:Swt1 family HEPN domain-containing protein n=1 Tax=Anabaenopsis sp. FSS-46 TaxID=2971766 RepID=UPI002476D15A|nr:Swt1 family HEPN domain-containing protein [Anabaenopsis sp. FSS-46]MDH6100179.1 Swt1 family HEPN domain-containing protein [Anabaenopsis sp. FSS-46]